MAFQSSVPPSVLAKLAKSAEGEEEDGEPTKKREDYKKVIIFHLLVVYKSTIEDNTFIKA